VQTIKQFHPYEEPPIEIHPLERRPQRGLGAGRRLTLDVPLTVAEIGDRLRPLFGVRRLQYAAFPRAPEKHTMIGICAGSGASLLDAAIEQDCTVFVTGELKHHEALAAITRGCGVIVAGHTNTERGYLPTLARAIASRVSGLTCDVSRSEGDPFADL
jgi:putative NIF3 family GTP cyclohydrolase 1 type 2